MTTTTNNNNNNTPRAQCKSESTDDGKGSQLII